ncbi:MAG TPA: FIST N-terminal domain-containing protein, partial [Thermoanaerobaculia bacterium]|nr:FIST N-terminal domain-containing protein [Thermoanaerobaculia bacterium]
MRWASSLSSEARLDGAVAECSDALEADLGGAAPDLVAAFVSPHFADSWTRLPSIIARRFPKAVLLGCSGGGVLAAGREVEGDRALAMVAASLPGVRLTPLVVRPGDFVDVESVCPPIARLVESASAAPPKPRTTPHFVVLPDPFSCPAETLIAELDRLFPGSVKIGGLASGARQPGGNLLWAGGEPVHGGAVALAFEGELAVDTIVAQGCRPIGLPLFVTSGHGHLIQELDGLRPLDLLRELHEAASPRDRELFRGSLFVGVVMREGESEYGPGDFLIRNIIQLDGETGVLAVAAEVREGSVVQFHLRDAETSAEDLRHHLREQPAGGTPAGAL